MAHIYSYKVIKILAVSGWCSLCHRGSTVMASGLESGVRGSKYWLLQLTFDPGLTQKYTKKQ